MIERGVLKMAHKLLRNELFDKSAPGSCRVIRLDDGDVVHIECVDDDETGAIVDIDCYEAERTCPRCYKLL